MQTKFRRWLAEDTEPEYNFITDKIGENGFKCIYDQCDAFPSVHRCHGAKLFFLLNRVAVLADSHVWNLKHYCNINISRLEQVYHRTGG